MIFKLCCAKISDDDNNNPKEVIGDRFSAMCCPCLFRARKPVEPACDDAEESAPEDLEITVVHPGDLEEKGIDNELEDLTIPLLQRTADTNKFLRADADAALDVMCDNLPAQRVIAVLTGKGASHQNALVRCACARLMMRLTQRLGHEKIFHLSKDHRDRVLHTGVKFLQEGNLDTRSYAKDTFRELMKHELFGKTIIDVVQPRTLRNIEKTLRSLQ